MIREVFKRATTQDLADGLSWYSYAHFFSHSMARQYGVSVEQAAGVISALSPRNKWERNLSDAERSIKSFLTHGSIQCTVSTFGSNKLKAEEILSGKPVEEVLVGLKTWNFYNNILDPMDENFVTIDFHAVNIYEGSLDVKSLSKGYYKTVVEAYKDAAYELGLIPNQLQAVTWVVWRRERVNILGL